MQLEQQIQIDEDNKYLKLLEDLKKDGIGKMQCFGESMMPLMKSGSVLTFEPKDDYNPGDIVFCKVGEYFIDAHFIINKDEIHGYLIAGNNTGYLDGWTKTIYAKVIEAEYEGKKTHNFY